MDATLWIVEVQIFGWANVWDGSISMAHPISDRIPIITPFTIHVFQFVASRLAIAVRVFGLVGAMLLRTDGNNAR